eukprot:11937227-Alexandrium_andersonii.AAC.1
MASDPSQLSVGHGSFTASHPGPAPRALVRDDELRPVQKLRLVGPPGEALAQDEALVASEPIAAPGALSCDLRADELEGPQAPEVRGQELPAKFAARLRTARPLCCTAASSSAPSAAASAPPHVISELPGVLAVGE